MVSYPNAPELYNEKVALFGKVNIRGPEFDSQELLFFLAFQNWLIFHMNKAFVTDNKGNFSFSAPDTAVNVSIASVGFEQQNIR